MRSSTRLPLQMLGQYLIFDRRNNGKFFEIEDWVKAAGVA